MYNRARARGKLIEIQVEVLMAKTPNLVIDFGYQHIKVLQVKPTKGGVQIVQAGKEPLLLPPNADSETIYQRVEETLPILLQRLGIREKRAIVTLPGRSAFTRQFKVPVVRGRQLERIVRYEARQHVPFPLDQVNLDYQVSAAGDANELEINLVAVRREAADAYSRILRKQKNSCGYHRNRTTIHLQRLCGFLPA